jgi:hypothetical protein
MYEICFDEETFDRSVWDALVAPRLEWNLYRVRPMQNIGAVSTRGAVMAQALVGVASKPSLAWMLLSRYCLEVSKRGFDS